MRSEDLTLGPPAPAHPEQMHQEVTQKGVQTSLEAPGMQSWWFLLLEARYPHGFVLDMELQGPWDQGKETRAGQAWGTQRSLAGWGLSLTIGGN